MLKLKRVGELIRLFDPRNQIGMKLQADARVLSGSVQERAHRI